MKDSFFGKLAFLTFVLGSLVLGCADDSVDPVEPEGPASLLGPSAGKGSARRSDLARELTRKLDTANARLALAGANVRAALISTIGPREGQGITVLWRNVGNKSIGIEFVPGDPRRTPAEDGWSSDPNRITFAIDTSDGNTLNGTGSAVTTAEIRDAMETWESVRCSQPGLNEVPAGGDIGFLAFLLSGGAIGGGQIVADVQHAGWLELETVSTTIAFTAPFVFVDGQTGVPTDIDNDGALDYAFAEIYYEAVCEACATPAPFIWEVDDGVNDPAGLDIDIESIALHESGHGLGQAHFGKGFFTPGNDPFLHLAPGAVMAAAYTGPQTSLRGTDNGGHCSLWGSWPSR